MTKAYLYEVHIKKVKGAEDPSAEQNKLIRAFRTAAKRRLEEEGLMAEFSYAGKSASNMERTLQVYASKRVAAAIRQLEQVKKVERAVVSAHALTKDL